MIEHKYTEPAEINFSKLEERLEQINNTTAITCFQFLRSFWWPITRGNVGVPTLIMATGGSKAATYYLQLFLESNGIVSEVIEPSDYAYKSSIKSFGRLITISKSGTTNGVIEALHTFEGEKYLITGDYVQTEQDYVDYEKLFNLIYWKNSGTDDEKSFVSIISTLGPMIMFLDLACSNNKELSTEQLKNINQKIKLLIAKSKERIKTFNFSFSQTDLIQIISSYNTKTSATILESNLTETGTCATVVHNKGSYCHGRSNLSFQNPKSPLIYLTHQKKDLDEILISTLMEQYPNMFLFHTLDIEDNIFWKEFYLSLQMFFLSKKISEDKNIDLTQPEYNPQIVKRLYNFKGEM